MSIASVFVVGSLHYDILLRAPHLPTHDETVLGSDVKYVCGGKGGNQAVAASQHGAKTAFAGAVGNDYFGDVLLSNLRDAKVDVGQIKSSENVASGMSVAIIQPNGDYGAVVASGANQSFNGGEIALPDDLAILILQNEVPETANIDVAQRAYAAGAKVILNAAPMRALTDELLSNVDYLIVNRPEAEAWLGRALVSRDDALGALVDYTAPNMTIIITLGQDGLVFRTNDEIPRFVLPQSVETVSSHGAGDSFVGAFAARLAMGDELLSALEYASCAAALHVSTPVDQRNEISPETVKQKLSNRRLD